MPFAPQLDRLVALDVPELAGLAERDFRSLADGLPHDRDGLIAVHPDLVAPSRLTPKLSRSGKAGFVVVDMADLDAFSATVTIPGSPLYLVTDVERGDDYRNQSPDEVAPQIQARTRTPLTISEGISWLLQQPDLLEPNFCFMTPGSRLHKPTGRLDARTPAIWISGGTGRDGAHAKGAPKVGWCWAGNRHTWLGIASCAGRLGP